MAGIGDSRFPRMHEDEVAVDAALVKRLLASQFPDLAALPLTRVDSAGTDNAIYRIGDELAARLPRIAWAEGQIACEFEWLPRLAPELPVAVTTPVAPGEADEGYPFAWGIYRWLDGASPVRATADLARDVASFANALHRIEPTSAPVAGRGVHIADRDDRARAALAQLSDRIDVPAARAAWERILEVPAYEGDPVWIHGDLLAGNLLVRAGRLAAVLDWAPGVGDPAADCLPAWSLLSPVRAEYREALDVDDATWVRGRGWALLVGLQALPYYLETNPVIVEWARGLIDAVLSDPL